MNTRDPIFPILGTMYKREDFAPIKLAVEQESQKDLKLDTYEGLASYIDISLSNQNARAGYGGYLEKRDIYAPGLLFKTDSSKRDVHLGLDIWTPAKTNIHAPVKGKVHSFRYNDKHLDYGATIVLEHEIEGKKLHTLYGHLSLDSLTGLIKGQLIEQGQAFAQTGDPTENGGWVPHLHFQLIKDMMGMNGDFPGVASVQSLELYQANCPDPAGLFRMEI